MKSKAKIYICYGFNNYFKIPVIDNTVRASFRTAVIIKKLDFFDEWNQYYDGIIWSIILKISSLCSAELKIKCDEDKTGFVTSYSEWVMCQQIASEHDAEYQADTPKEIFFIKESKPICKMTFENWADIVSIEPYSTSFTYSFYSLDANTDQEIGRSLRQTLSTNSEVGTITERRESPSPRWYWIFQRIWWYLVR